MDEKNENPQESGTNKEANKETKEQENSQENEIEEDRTFTNFEQEMMYESSLKEYDEFIKGNKDLNELHKNRELNDNLGEALNKNAKEIADKEEEIQKKQKLLDEQAKANNKEAKFSGDDIEQEDPLAKEKQELQNLKEKAMALKEQKDKCEEDISQSVGRIASAQDVYEVYKNLINIYKRMKESSNIEKNRKFNKEKMKELENKINSYTKKMNEVLKQVGMTKEGKELCNMLTKDIYEAQKESKKNHQNLVKQATYYKELRKLMKDRNTTLNLDKNTSLIQKIYKNIMNETPEFQHNYPNMFKEITKIINGKEQTQEQNRGRSV
ncbi:hypothetical protein [Campylobacter troglodytis]|uniref:hypothetical protein n=1 Tax=Campylobacter troglodytis TaxID=654363 RepID=UPI001157A491|nr:hypothetical protein [Campylobacter troglodytis]TQR56254.1 hypothetical protein DMC01_09220 [Campylobacter troglodytis]